MAIAILMLMTPGRGTAQNPLVERASVSSGGAEAFYPGDETRWSGWSQLSLDGRYVAFDSIATNLVPDKLFSYRNAYVFDRYMHNTVRVSVTSSGLESADDPLLLHSFRPSSGKPSISASGRFVSFTSTAHLDSGDTNTFGDVYVHDRDVKGTGQFDLPGNTATILESVSSSGEQANGGSGIANYISADGRFIAFESQASNLAPGAINGFNIYVRDRDVHNTGTFDQPGNVATTLESVGWNGVPLQNGAALAGMSADGRFIAFSTTDPNTVPNDNGLGGAYIRDRDPDGDGVFDEPGEATTFSVALSSTGVQADGSSGFQVWQGSTISPNGRYVVFVSQAGNLVPGISGSQWNAYVHDLQTGQTSFVTSLSSTPNFQPTFSGNGKLLFYFNYLDPNHLHVYDVQSQSDSVLQIPTTDHNPPGCCIIEPSANEDGSVVSFTSVASNLVPYKSYFSDDVFVYAVPRCANGASPTGSLSGQLYGQEPFLGYEADPLDTYVPVVEGERAVNCTVIAPTGL
ncbi:MAG: hypothetical protein ACYDCC_07010 [Actinomycetota bacterium]